MEWEIEPVIITKRMPIIVYDFNFFIILLYAEKNLVIPVRLLVRFQLKSGKRRNLIWILL